MSAFDPNSNDAMFAKVLAKLDEHGAQLERIETKGTDAYELLTGRVTKLEGWRENIKGKVAVVAFAISALITGVIELGSMYFHWKK